MRIFSKFFHKSILCQFRTLQPYYNTIQQNLQYFFPNFMKENVTNILMDKYTSSTLLYYYFDKQLYRTRVDYVFSE